MSEYKDRLELLASSLIKELKNKSDDNILKNEKQLDNETKRLYNKDYANLIEMREKYANKIFNFICLYSVFVGIILLFEGSHLFGDKIDWDTSVIITLITTTLTEVLGLMFIVLHYIFPNKK
jgi:hypothetical protein